MIPSWGWILFILVGGAMVVVGNIYYTLSRDKEDKQTLAREARAVLVPEIERNLKVLGKTDSEFDQRHIPFETFSTAAWETVSKGGLLQGMGGEEIGQIAVAYQLVYKANETHKQIMELAIGVASALQDNVKHKDYLIKNLKIVLKELKPILVKIGAGYKPAQVAQSTRIEPAH